MTDPLFARFGQEFAAGEVLFREGEPGDRMFVIQTGAVRITKAMAWTRPAGVATLPDPYDSTAAVKVIGRRLVVFRRAMVGPKLQTAVLTYKLGDTFELGASTPWAPELSWDGNAQFDKLGSLFLGTAVESDTRYLYLCDLDANTCQEKTAINLPISGTVVTASATSDARNANAASRSPGANRRSRRPGTPSPSRPSSATAN